MSYAVNWIPGSVVFGTVLLLLIVPEFALIGVLVVALAALVALVALVAAALWSPYLLVRGLRRRRARPKPRRTPRRIPAPRAIPSRSGG